MRSPGTRERILISFRSVCSREKSRFFVKTANWPPLKVFSGALYLVFMSICYVVLVLFCGFFRCFRRFGDFFELVFHSDYIRQKNLHAVLMQTGMRFVWLGENKLHHCKPRVYGEMIIYSVHEHDLARIALALRC